MRAIEILLVAFADDGQNAELEFDEPLAQENGRAIGMIDASPRGGREVRCAVNPRNRKNRRHPQRADEQR